MLITSGSQRVKQIVHLSPSFANLLLRPRKYLRCRRSWDNRCTDYLKSVSISLGLDVNAKFCKYRQGISLKYGFYVWHGFRNLVFQFDKN